MTGGVYLFRTRRPGLIGRLPWWFGLAATLLSGAILLLLGWWWPAALLGLLLNSRHNSYVGETIDIQQRKSEHLKGGGRYMHAAKSWTDLEPTHYYLPLPAWKWLLLLVETVAIVLLWPVYNHKKNLWNPRRIPLYAARWQRYKRDMWRWSFNMRPAHLMIIIALIVMGVTR